jgi:lactate permease
MTFTIPADPLGNAALAAVAAAVPVVLLFFALVVLRSRAHRAGLLGTGAAAAIAVVAFGMPVGLVLLAALHGALFGLVPIATVVVAAVFLQDVATATGSFGRLRDALARATSDRTLQALLIAFGFGALLEGSAGFGAPVAISAGILVGLGFPALGAAGLCLLANTVPVAFAAVGLPIAALAQATGLPEGPLGVATARLLAPLAVAVPVVLVLRVAGRRPPGRAIAAALAAGLAFSATQLLVAETLGPQLPALAGALAAMAVLGPFLRGAGPGVGRDLYAGAAPFLALALLVSGWSLPPVRALLTLATPVIPVPFLHLGVFDPARGAALPATWSVPWLSGAATAILLAAVLSALLGGLRPRETARLLGATTGRLLPTIGAVSAFLAFASIATYSGMMQALGRALAGSGAFFPLLSPAIGWLGVLMTGSDTASNAVFGRLQVTTAAETGMPPVLAAAANTVGGTAGKMVSPQSIAVACAATGLSGREGDLLRRAMPLSLALCGLVGLLTLAAARFGPGLVPVPRPEVASGVAGPALGAGLLALSVVLAALVARAGRR